MLLQSHRLQKFSAETNTFNLYSSFGEGVMVVGAGECHKQSVKL